MTNELSNNDRLENTTSYTGVLFMLLSALSFSLMNGIVKYLDDVGSYQLVFFRAITSLFLCLAYAIYFKVPILGTQRGWLFLRGLVGTISLTLFFVAIKIIPLGSAVTLRYLSPIFAAILALILLKEKIHKAQWFLFFLAFTGAALLKGFDFRVTPLGFSLIIASAIFSGLVYIVIKKIGKSEHPMVIVAYFMFVATVVGGILSIPSWSTPSQSEFLLLLSLGTLGFIGQIFMTMAIQRDALVRVIPFKYVEVALAVLIGFVWFGEGFGLVASLGILLIMIAMVFNVILTNKKG